jgi:16S rRNA (cytosine967-C5)-methyltransferase
MAEHGQGIAPRRAALALLDGVLGDGRSLSELIEAPDSPLSSLQPPDRARAQRLALATLRQFGRADRLLGPHLRRRPPLTVHNLLRLALCEVFVEGGAPHGVVNAAVTLARMERDTQRAAGMVNAVLRKTTAEPAERWHALPVPDLPKWLRKPMIDAYGKPEVQAMETAHLAGAPLDLTLLRDLAPEGEVLPTGSLRLAAAGAVSALPGFDAGNWWVQDAAAALPARALAVRPGERVLDLCAAPGGKTLQLAAAGAEVTALDISGPRLERLRENLQRTGLAARIVEADALEWVPDAPFDAVLLDAPCSATGTIRRHPDLPHIRDGSEIAGLVNLQARLIDRALGFLKPGGRLVYATCSLLPEEGEGQLAAALARHPGLEVTPGALALPGVEEAWITDAGGLRLRPDYWAERGGMDGFFIGALRWNGAG